MEEDAIVRAAPTPRLLNLIRDDREWKQLGEAEDGRRPRSTTISDDAEDRKLELKLGLPDVVQGEEDAAARLAGEKIAQHEESCTALSLGCLPAHPKLTAATGAKRGFFATVGVNSQGCNQHRQGCENELTLGGGETAAGERKKGCCPPSSSHDSAARPMHNASSSTNPQRRSAVPPVVGWPPVRSFRRNLTNGSSSKQSPERQNHEAADKVKIDHKRSSLVKINMDGIPIGRKIKIAAYDSYQELSSAVEELFRGFLEAQKDSTCDESREQGVEQKMFSGLVDGTGEYTLVYEHDKGGRTLVRDLPWSVFSSTAKRLWVMRSSELPIGLVTTTQNATGRMADN